jgi:hypothetical protein
MGTSDHLADMNEVYVHMKTACKEQSEICLQHMEERFGGLTVPKKGRARTQHRVPIDHLANMDGPNIRCDQPRPWYTGLGDKFIAKYRRHMEELFTVLGGSNLSPHYLIIQHGWSQWEWIWRPFCIALNV